MNARHEHTDSKHGEAARAPGCSTLSDASGFVPNGREFSGATRDTARRSADLHNLLSSSVAGSSQHYRASDVKSHMLHDSHNFSEGSIDSASGGHHGNCLPPISQILEMVQPHQLGRSNSEDRKLYAQEGGSEVPGIKPHLWGLSPLIRGRQSLQGIRRGPFKIKEDSPGPGTNATASDDGRSTRVANAPVTVQRDHGVTASSRCQSHTVPPWIPEIYSRLMLVHALGYPLYMPEPDRGLPKEYRKKGVRIGDVGRVTPAGAFDFLFNTCLPTSHPVNPLVLPDDFEVLHHNDSSIRQDYFAPETFLLSGDVDEENDQFHCTGPEGSILALPEGGTLFEARDTRVFQEHAARHAENWYKYMTGYKGRVPSNGSLYLITGCIKSKSWGTATFHHGPDPGNCLQFISSPDDGPNIRTRPQHRWKKSGNIITKIGSSFEETPELNQCGFLRGFKIMLRQDVWDGLQKTVSVSSQRSSDMRFSGCERKFSVQSIESDSASIDTPIPNRDLFESDKKDIDTSSLIHPSDLINAMLLKSDPRARVALTHDSVWCETLRNRFTLGHFNFDIDKILESVPVLYDISLDESGSIFLKSKMECQIGASRTRTIDENSDMSQVGDPPSTPHSLTNPSNDEDHDEGCYSDEVMSVDDHDNYARMGAHQQKVVSYGHMMGVPIPSSAQGASSLHLEHVPAAPRSKRTSMARSSTVTSAVRAKSGCYTCRIRRKKCDEQVSENGGCSTCERLRLECLGFGVRRPDWLRDPKTVVHIRDKIKAFLMAQGLVRGHSGPTKRGVEEEEESSFLKLRSD